MRREEDSVTPGLTNNSTRGTEKKTTTIGGWYLWVEGLVDSYKRKSVGFTW